MTVDLDALEALYRDDKKRPVGTIGQADVLALIAELQQERERADGLEYAIKNATGRVLALSQALSRAEETIDRVKRVIATSGTLWGDELRINYGALSDALTEYDKQKGASDD